MRSTTGNTKRMAREAFDLLLELRERQNAYQLLTKAIAFLQMLAREKDEKSVPIMLSVRVVPLGKP